MCTLKSWIVCRWLFCIDRNWSINQGLHEAQLDLVLLLRSNNMVNSCHRLECGMVYYEFVLRYWNCITLSLEKTSFESPGDLFSRKADELYCKILWGTSPTKKRILWAGLPQKKKSIHICRPKTWIFIHVAKYNEKLPNNPCFSSKMTFFFHVRIKKFGF